MPGGAQQGRCGSIPVACILVWSLGELAWIDLLDNTSQRAPSSWRGRAWSRRVIRSRLTAGLAGAAAPAAPPSMRRSPPMPCSASPSRPAPGSAATCLPSSGRPTSRLHGLNASGRSPRALTLEHLRSIGLRARPDLWPALGQRAGRRRRLVRAPCPLRPYADAGAARSGRSRMRARAFRSPRSSPATGRTTSTRFGADAEFARVFTLDGRAPIAGERFPNPRLAETYATDRRGGPRGVLSWTVAERIEAQMAPSAAFSRARISRGIGLGLDRSRRTNIAATTFGSCRRTGKALPCWRC